VNLSSKGSPIKLTLPDGTVLDGKNPGALPKYSLRLIALAVQTNGSALSIPAADRMYPSGKTTYADPEYPKNKVYAGDVYLYAQSLNSKSGSSAPVAQLVATVELSVNSGGQISRCYTPDPCKPLQGSATNASLPGCNVCATPGSIWIGVSPWTGSGGNPICLPACGNGEILVSNGTLATGSTNVAYCKAPFGVGCVEDQAALPSSKHYGDCCTQEASADFFGNRLCGNNLITAPNPNPTGIWQCLGPTSFIPPEGLPSTCTLDKLTQYYGCTSPGSSSCQTICNCVPPPP
jgi:hypothetical protein